MEREVLVRVSSCRRGFSWDGTSWEERCGIENSETCVSQSALP